MDVILESWARQQGMVAALQRSACSMNTLMNQKKLRAGCSRMLQDTQIGEIAETFCEGVACRNG